MKSMFSLIGVGVISLLVLSVGACSATTIEAGHRGVVVNLGEATGVLGEGFHMVNPFTTDVIEMSVQQTKWDGETVAYTQDVQQADVKFTMTYSLNPDRVVATYRDVGVNWSSMLIPQVVYQATKDVFGSSRAVADTINRRSVVQSNIRQMLTERLAARGIIVHGFELNDIAFSDAFDQANEQKQIAVELANAARNTTVRIREEASQRVISATAEAESMRIRSQALASNPALTDYEAVKAWDGKLPTHMYGNTMPFIRTN